MKKQMKLFLVSASVLGGAMFVAPMEASAHGYVSSPPSRGYQGELFKNAVGWDAAMNKYGNVISQPQSLEAKKGFPVDGPKDGQIASANGAVGDFVLDRQSSDMWDKTDIHTGLNTFTWTYTAPHNTSKWHYYMTKSNWNPDAPITRDDLELIGTVDHDGTAATNNISHQIVIPNNRVGYHVVVAAWDVADTANAFYSTIDLNVTNNNLPMFPAKPTNVQADNVTKNSVSLSWAAQTTATSYDVYRDGKKIVNVASNKFEDKTVKSDKSYKYEIVAVSANGIESDKSTALEVKTLSEDAEELVTAPKGLHSMGETTTEISLMWGEATHTSGIAKYEIYRDGQYIASTTNQSYNDTNLKPNTTYSYNVKAISNDNQESKFSNQLVVSTQKEVETPNVGEYREFKIGTLTEPQKYEKGEVVLYKGDLYTTLQTHSNYGDESWNPKDAVTLFVFKTALNTTWDADNIYNLGDKVFYAGVEYEAKWWTKGNRPDVSDAWKMISNTVVVWNAEKAYEAGEQVEYEGKVYQAQWWTKGDKPDSSSAWILK